MVTRPTPFGDPGTTQDSQPSQVAVYRIYLQLQSLRANLFPASSAGGWADRLVTCVGFAQPGAELALATTIAGGTFLGIESSADLLKAAVRNSSCDFMVNTLDESLRVLKNELRKQKALSVGLLGDASEVLSDMVARGVQPDLVADTSPSRTTNPALLQLAERGAGTLDLQSSSSALALLQVVWTAASPADLKHMDSLALQQLPPQDAVRRRWLHQAAGCFHRQLPLQRVLGLSPDECTALLSAFQDAVSTGSLRSSATVHWQAFDGAQQSRVLHRP